MAILPVIVVGVRLKVGIAIVTLIALVELLNTAVIRATVERASTYNPGEPVRMEPGVIGMGAIVAVTLVMEALTARERVSAEPMVVQYAAPLIHSGGATMGVGTIQELLVMIALSLDLVAAALTPAPQVTYKMMQIGAMHGGGLA